MMPRSAQSVPAATPVPDDHGRFGDFGGQYVPEVLMGAIQQLDQAYAEAKRIRRSGPSCRGI